MNKDSASFRNSGAYSSPGTPEDYGDNNKGWCSERVPLPDQSIYSKQRRTSVNVLMPYNNGRTMPSKWEDAERWITSPVSGSGICKALPQPPQRRPKSKSGPLGATPGGDAYFSGYSPGFPLIEGGRMNGIFAGSPLTTGVLVPNGYSFHHGGIDENGDSSVVFIDSSYPDSQDEKSDGRNVSRVVSRRDMATQMSPVGSPESSPKGRLLLSTSPPPPVERNSHISAGVEVRDVQVDKRVTMTKQPKRHTKKMEKNGSTEVKDLALTWSPTTEGAMELSKLEKEEARITAWENLQNAKAEASIRKLEMKLEKKKSESMDKIMNKLEIAQMKAQEMRKSLSANQAPRTHHKVMFLHRYPKISLTRCFVPSTLKSDKSEVENSREE
ncbi:putative remorin [Helianthus annuus]|nr:putative remorin [Helianthus annuus]